jgi:prophage tail gpP-like protein
MTQRFCVRTKLTDAVYSAAPVGVQVRNQSIKQFVLAVYKSLGFTEKDFDFRGDVSRDLMTGRSTRGGKTPRPLDPLKEEEAKVQPPEACFAAVERHLRRHGFMHWDGADGRIVVAAPDDGQEPLYALRLQGGADGQYNNCLEATRTQDVSEAPTELGVFGTGAKGGQPRARASAIVTNPQLIAAGFTRRAAIVDEAMRNKELASRRASRELAQRNRGLERITVTVDGIAFRDGLDPLPWAHDTTADVYFEMVGGALGLYYIEDVQMARDAESGDRTRIQLVPKGVWVL